jgi:hypothetical protein
MFPLGAIFASGPALSKFLSSGFFRCCCSSSFHLFVSHLFFFFLSTYSLYRGDSLCQFPIALHCTLVRFPPPSHPHNLLLSHLKHLQDILSFYFMYVYEVHQPYSLTFISFIHSLPTSTPPQCTYFTVLSFIFNSKVNVRWDFSMYPSCAYT